ncbi:MAG: lipid II flippase Amj family protein [Symbiobacteriia bacterium]
MARFVLVLALTAVVHLVATLANSVRLAGVRSGRLATASSLFSVVSIAAGTANIIQTPFLTKNAEELITHYQGSGQWAARVAAMSQQFRWVLLSAAVGTAIGALLTPTFVKIFTRMILRFEHEGSVPRLMLSAAKPDTLKAIYGSLAWPRAGILTEARRAHVPKRLLLLNVAIMAAFTTGVVSSIWAGVLAPDLRGTASNLSGVVNGIGTVLLALTVDPAAALITDQAIRGARPESDVKALTTWLVLTRLVGNLLAQLLFVPGAWLIVQVARYI